MRPLTEQETRLLFQKLIKYISPDSVKLLLARPDATYCFRLHKGDRVYYVRRDILKLAANVARDNLVSLGVCFGKFTKSGTAFRLSITALSTLAPYGKYKIWLKPGAEQQYLYGHNVVKSGLARVGEDVPKYAGVFIYGSVGNNSYKGGSSNSGTDPSGLPLGFGVAAKSTLECRSAQDPLTVVCFHQADVGEYLRNESYLA